MPRVSCPSHLFPEGSDKESRMQQPLHTTEAEGAVAPPTFSQKVQVRKWISVSYSYLVSPTKAEGVEDHSHSSPKVQLRRWISTPFHNLSAWQKLRFSSPLPPPPKGIVRKVGPALLSHRFSQLESGRVEGVGGYPSDSKLRSHLSPSSSRQDLKGVSAKGPLNQCSLQMMIGRISMDLPSQRSDGCLAN